MGKPGFSGIRDKSFTWERRGARDVDLNAKRAIVVGGTNGIGRALSRTMAARGAKVTVVGRTFRDEGTTGLAFVEADLSRMTEAARVGRSLPDDVDVLVMTTGIMAAKHREVTTEGLERDMAVSYLSRLALLRELGPRLDGVRVFIMGFPGTGQAGVRLDDLNAERAYASMDVHMNTVAGNEALVLDAVQRYPRASFFGLNPGLIQTGIRANVLGGESALRFKIIEALIGLFTVSADTYAERTVPLLFAPELEGKTGLMFNAKGHAILPTEGLTKERVTELLEASEALVARAMASASAA